MMKRGITQHQQKKNTVGMPGAATVMKIPEKLTRAKNAVSKINQEMREFIEQNRQTNLYAGRRQAMAKSKPTGRYKDQTNERGVPEPHRRWHERIM